MTRLAIERLRSVMQRTGLGRSRIYELMEAKDDAFPGSVSLGGRAKGWVSEEVDEWIRKRIKERDQMRGSRAGA
ncbi:MAG: AlpA family phage regulatory protein [Rhodomicrobium sp.]